MSGPMQRPGGRRPPGGRDATAHRFREHELVLTAPDREQLVAPRQRRIGDDEPLSDEEREELFRIRAEMEAGDAVPWPDVKRPIGQIRDPDEAAEEDLRAVREGRKAFERGECIEFDALKKLLSG